MGRYSSAHGQSLGLLWSVHSFRSYEIICVTAPACCSFNFEHRDLSFRNVLFAERHNVKTGAINIHIVLFDLGGSTDLDKIPHGVSVNGTVVRMQPGARRLGANGLHTDTYMLACGFVKRLYKECSLCARELPAQVSDTTSFRYAFTQIMMDNDAHPKAPDFKVITKLIQDVTHL